MQLYDTFARGMVPIQGSRPGALSIYACGPTVYRDAHVGNMRTFLLPDLIRRVAEYRGVRVRLVQNITDVGHMADDRGLDGAAALGSIDEGQGAGDDRILAQAQAEGRSALDVARHYEAAFRADCSALNITPADEYPRASESVPLMIDLIAVLLERGHAYVGGDGSIFFDARSYPEYGALSGNRLQDLRPGHRFEGRHDPAKRFHADWALWKSSGPHRTQLVWDTPWGRGFPGWHTECSAMSLNLLGPEIDIHTGGIDLRFPHHEDERAQSNCAADREVVRHWVHGEHLLFGGRKMSKSTGNVVLVRDVIEAGQDPLALRLAFLGSRFRQQTNLTWDSIAAADVTLRRWRTRVAEWAEHPSAPIPHKTLTDFVTALEQDLDTPRALAELRAVERDSGIAPGARFEFFALADRILGLDLVRDVGRLPRPAGALDPAAQRLLDARERARADRDWAASDRLRDELATLGLRVVDTPEGQQVEIAT